MLQKTTVFLSLFTLTLLTGCGATLIGGEDVSTPIDRDSGVPSDGGAPADGGGPGDAGKPDAHCENVGCPAIGLVCGPGEVEGVKPGECCPSCIPATDGGNPCKDVACPDIMPECRPGEVFGTAPGECCPRCLPGDEDGGQPDVNPCEAVDCPAVEPICKPGEKAGVKPGECCPSCIPSPDLTACKQDSDCAKVPRACCTCGYDGDFTSINASHVKDYEQNLCPKGVACAPCMPGGHPDKNIPWCKSGQCALRAPPEQCPQIKCAQQCPTGFARDEKGCQTCNCEPAPDMKACKQVSDCVMAKNTCCSCGSPGEMTAVNRNFKEQFEKGLCRENQGCGGGCPMPPPNTTTLACTNNQCVLCPGSPGPECVATGERDKYNCPVWKCEPVCPPAMPVCPNGARPTCVTSPGNPCPVCTCPDTCMPVACDLACAYGYKTDDKGCELCACKPEGSCPTNPPNQCESSHACQWTGSNCVRSPKYHCVSTGGSWDGQSCSCPTGKRLEDLNCVDNACAPVQCRIACPDGFATDAKGCKLCQCAKSEDPICLPLNVEPFAMSGCRTPPGLARPTGVVLRSTAELNGFYKTFGCASSPPKVDFTKQMVVVAVKGNGGCKAEGKVESAMECRLETSVLAKFTFEGQCRLFIEVFAGAVLDRVDKKPVRFHGP
ncbi:MAG: hypothetical protein GMKNLPBB_03029 [Myxococcota bacterium]|nr:hypothetical protein [Myxococcota bacterium]